MQWNIVYLEPVEEWFNTLTPQQLKSLAKELRLLELSGNQLKLPHSRTLGAGLFELRERTFGLRLYYTFNGQQLIILLHAGDKKSQAKDIKKARQQLEAYRRLVHES